MNYLKSNLNEADVCWSFSQDRAKRWADDIFDGMVNKHIAYGKTKFFFLVHYRCKILNYF